MSADPPQAYGLVASYVRDQRNNSKWPTNWYMLSSLPILCFGVFCLHKVVWGVRVAFGLIRHGLKALLQPVIGGVHESQKLAISDFPLKLSLPPISFNGYTPSKAVTTNSCTQRASRSSRVLVIPVGFGNIGFAKSGGGGQIFSPNL